MPRHSLFSLSLHRYFSLPHAPCPYPALPCLALPSLFTCIICINNTRRVAGERSSPEHVEGPGGKQRHDAPNTLPDHSSVTVLTCVFRRTPLAAQIFNDILLVIIFQDKINRKKRNKAWESEENNTTHTGTTSHLTAAHSFTYGLTVCVCAAKLHVVW